MYFTAQPHAGQAMVRERDGVFITTRNIFKGNA
jgi:hypothetical protein